MPTFNEALTAPMYLFPTPRSVQRTRVWVNGSGSNPIVTSAGWSFSPKAAGETESGLSGCPAAAWLYGWKSSGAFAPGADWTIPIDDLIVPGSKFVNVILPGECTEGSITWLCKLQSCPSEGTSDTWTDLATGEATMTDGGRSDMVFAPVAVSSGAPVYTHGAFYSGDHEHYRLFFEITAVSDSPTAFGLYFGMTNVSVETDVFKLLGGATV